MTATWVIDERMLRWWGKNKGWTTLNEIALGLDVAPSTLSRVINGKSVPGQQLLGAIRLVFGEEAFGDITSVQEVMA